MPAAKKTTAKKAPAKKPAAPKVAPELVLEDGQWYIVSGNKRLDVGRSERYAQKMLNELS
jgi:hypothetical protein